MKNTEHPNMKGKTAPQILAEAKPLITELKGLANDPDFSLQLGSKEYTGKQLYDEVINLTPFGRSYISSWHDGALLDSAYGITKKKQELKKSLHMRMLLVAASGIFVMVTCYGVTLADGMPGFIKVIGTVLMFIGAIILFNRKIKEVKEFLTVHTSS